MLAAALGPVEQLWRGGAADETLSRNKFPLDPRVVALPIGGMEAVLWSEKRQLKSEN